MKKNQILVELGAKIRMLRMEKGWSQEELADRADLHWTYIGGIERGERNVATLNLVKIAKALKVAVGELFNSKM